MLQRWVRKHPTMLTTNLAASIGLACFWDKGPKYLLSAIPLCTFAGTYVYSRFHSRDRVSSKEAIVVTGCDSGLGFSLALHCRHLGATVIAGVLRQDGPGAKRLRENDIHVRFLDVTRKKSLEEFTIYVRDLLARERLALRCLINNAGVMIFGEFEWQTEEQILGQVEVNLLGTMRITRELMPLIRMHSSRIIVVSSHCTSQPLPGVAAYGATKAAINAWATAIRVELKKYGVRVVCFVPGSFTTESNILARQSEHFEAMRTSMSEEARNFYGDYFNRYAEYFAPMAREVEPRKLENKRIYDVFEGALLDRHPSAVYKCEPWRYFFYHGLFKITPTSVRDLLIEKFVQLPAWKESRVDKTSEVSVSAPSAEEIPRTKFADPRNVDVSIRVNEIPDKSTRIRETEISTVTEKSNDQWK